MLYRLLRTVGNFTFYRSFWNRSESIKWKNSKNNLKTKGTRMTLSSSNQNYTIQFAWYICVPIFVLIIHQRCNVEEQEHATIHITHTNTISIVYQLNGTHQLDVNQDNKYFSLPKTKLQVIISIIFVNEKILPSVTYFD